MGNALLYKRVINIFLAQLLTAFSFAQNGMVKGIVKGNREALLSATISMGSETVLTDHAGGFFISIPPGTYTLTITHIGYIKIEQSISLNSGQTQLLEFNMTKDEQTGEAVVLGSRSSVPRSNLNTPVPVDVVRGNDLSKSMIELNQQLALLIPSFNSPPQSNAISAHTIPATLRGLNPDQSLVLLNGRRRHSTAIVYLFSGMGYGTAPVDLNAISPAAIEKIEILRDGAAAQYGSDAIAGIINLELKKSTGKTSVDLHLGQYYKGDGKTVSFSINRGFELNKKGFLNFTADYCFRTPTQRQGVYQGTVYYTIDTTKPRYYQDSIRNLDNQMIAQRGFSRSGHRPIGTPGLLSSGWVMNGGYPFSNKTKLSWTATLNYQLASDESSSVYRYPKQVSQVITELFPDGFLPKIDIPIWNFSGITGIEGVSNNGWHWDVGTVFGNNSYSYDVSNTNNASLFGMGKNAPTKFYSGALLFTQSTSNLNFSRDLAKKTGRIKSFNMALGGEFRTDHYQVKEGEEASWKNYTPNSLPRKIGGAQAFPGFQPENTVNKTRYVTAMYTELEMDMNKKFLWNLASRYEYYNDFGGNLAGKLAMRYKFSERLLLRGSISNGFRAPSMQQRYYSSVNQVVRFGQLFVTGNYRNDGDVAAAFGIAPLKAERSINASAGLTSTISKNITITTDAYWIQIRDRIIFTGLIQRNSSTPKIGEILNNLNRRDIDAVRFFTNAINTRTQGIDILVNSRWLIGKSVLNISFSVNFTKTSIYGVIQSAANLPDSANYKDLLFNREERGRAEHGQPHNKIILSASYKTGRWEFSTSHIHYGKVAQLFPDPVKNPDEFFSPKIVSSFDASYKPTRWLTFTIGARNIFDIYPDKLKNYENTQEGLLIYSTNGTQTGYNGGYYFVNMNFNF